MNSVPGIGDHQCGLYLAGGICASLLKKERTGKGEKVTVSLYNAALFTMGTMVVSANYDNTYPVKKKDLPNPLLKHYMTKDNRCLQLAIPQYDKFIVKVLELIGIPEVAEDERFKSFKGLKENTSVLTGIIQSAIEKKDVDEWLSLFNEGVLVNTPVKFKHHTEEEFRLAPLLGEHTEEVLMTLGYGESEIRRMAEDKVVRM